MTMGTTREKGLAWAMLSHKKMHFSLSITGIAFAVLLMFVEIGFFKRPSGLRNPAGEKPGYRPGHDEPEEGLLLRPRTVPKGAA